MKHTQKLIILLCSALLILISACPSGSGSDDDNTNTNTNTGPQLGSSVESSNNTLTLTFKTKIKFVDGVIPTNNIVIRSGIDESSKNYTIEFVEIISSGSSPEGYKLRITVKENLIGGQISVDILPNTFEDESGVTNTNKIAQSYEIINNIQEYNLSYNTTSAITFGTATTFNPTTGSNLIPAAAQVTYTIGPTLITDTLPNDITMNGADIVVAATTPVGAYNLTVTATASGTGYTGTKTANVTITVVTTPTDISGATFTFTYDTSQDIVLGSSLPIISNIPEEAQLSYSIDPTSAADILPDGITMNKSAIEIADTTPVGTYNITITATASGTGYTGTKTTEITITVVTSATAPAAVQITSTVSANTITLTWNKPNPGKAADGTTDATIISYKVYYSGIPRQGLLAQLNTASTKVIDAKNITTDPVTITLTALTNGASLAKDHIYSFGVTTTNDAGKTSVLTNTDIADTITKAAMSDYTLSYDLSSTTFTVTEGKSATIPTKVNTTTLGRAAPTYAIALQGGGAAPNGITMDESTIEVADTVAVGSYALTVTATPTDTGYTGTKTANITIIVEADPSVGAPGSITPTLIAEAHEVIISWNKPDAGQDADGNASTIKSYTIFYASQTPAVLIQNIGGTTKEIEISDGNTTIHRIALETFTKYAFGVRATNADNKVAPLEAKHITEVVTADDLKNIIFSYNSPTILFGTATEISPTATSNLEPEAAAIYSISGDIANGGISMKDETEVIVVSSSVPIGVYTVEVEAEIASSGYIDSSSGTVVKGDPSSGTYLYKKASVTITVQ